MKKFGVSVEHSLDITQFRESVKPVFEAASKELPEKYRLIAYNTAYTKRVLEVYSKPPEAKVSYCRYGDINYDSYHEVTDTGIELEWAAWYIRVELDKYIPEEKLFDPNVSNKWRVDFELKPVNP